MQQTRSVTRFTVTTCERALDRIEQSGYTDKYGIPTDPISRFSRDEFEEFLAEVASGVAWGDRDAARGVCRRRGIAFGWK